MGDLLVTSHDWSGPKMAPQRERKPWRGMRGGFRCATMAGVNRDRPMGMKEGCEGVQDGSYHEYSPLSTGRIPRVVVEHLAEGWRRRGNRPSFASLLGPLAEAMAGAATGERQARCGCGIRRTILAHHTGPAWQPSPPTRRARAVSSAMTPTSAFDALPKHRGFAASLPSTRRCRARMVDEGSDRPRSSACIMRSNCQDLERLPAAERPKRAPWQ